MNKPILCSIVFQRVKCTNSLKRSLHILFLVSIAISLILIRIKVNLAPELTEVNLEQSLEVFGEVKKVKIINNKQYDDEEIQVNLSKQLKLYREWGLPNLDQQKKQNALGMSTKYKDYLDLMLK